MTQQTNLGKWGITSEELEKSRDIRPLLKLSDLSESDRIEIEFQEDEPRTIKYEKDGQSKEFQVIKIIAHKLWKGNDMDSMDIEYDLPLSSKTLRIGVVRILQDNGGTLVGVNAMITVSMAEFKDYGTNRCYRISRIR